MANQASFNPAEFREGMLDELNLDKFEIKTPTGRKMRPHQGQSIWILAYGLSLGDQMLMGEFSDAARGGTDQVKLDEMFVAVCTMLSHVIIGWNILDARGKPFPQPSTGVEAIKAIPTVLFSYIVEQLQGTESEGNAEGGSAA